MGVVKWIGVKKGDLVTAKCLGVDEKGRVKMSRRAWLRDQKAAEAEAKPKRPRARRKPAADDAGEALESVG